MIKALIVDDEENSRLTLSKMLSDFCKNVKVVSLAASVQMAYQQAKAHTPDVVFLDIEMPIENGFKLLEYYETVPFKIIFTTAYDQYAVKAFRFSAVDYLLKPIDLEELRNAVDKLSVQLSKDSKSPSVSSAPAPTRGFSHYDALKHNISQQLRKIALPTTDGYSFIDIDDIIYCEANNNYTIIFTKSNGKIMVSKTLREYDEMLSEHNFFRLNRSHLVNLSYIREYKKAKKPIVIMANGVALNLTSTRRKEFLERLGNMY